MQIYMSNLWFSMKTRLVVENGPQKMRSGTALRGSKQRSGVEDGVVVRTLCVRKREVHKLCDPYLSALSVRYYNKGAI